MSAPLEAGAVILAAGEGRRMGGVVKAALALPSGESFLERIVATLRALGAAPIVVVEGARPLEVPAGVEVARNTRPEDGMLSSLQCGLRALSGRAPRKILLWPVDAPRVPAEVVRAVVEALEDDVDLAYPVHGGRGGHPAAFAARLIPAILAASPTESTREVLRGAGRVVRAVPVAAPEALDDVDTPEQYRALEG